jgi:preprotein translocase subunit SecE
MNASAAITRRKKIKRTRRLGSSSKSTAGSAASTPRIVRPSNMAEKKQARLTQEVQPENRFVQFYRETAAELRKVVWPTREQAQNLTIIVIVVVTVMSLFLGGIDAVLTQVFRFILER